MNKEILKEKLMLDVLGWVCLILTYGFTLGTKSSLLFSGMALGFFGRSLYIGFKNDK